MIKNILSVFIFLFCMSFFYLVGNTYLSDKQEKKIKNNRNQILQKIKNNTNGLPILVNDTNDVIEFNTGYKNENSKIRRNFWKLFIKND